MQHGENVMYNTDEVILNVKKYLKKMTFVINNNAVFTLPNVKIVNKNKVDDILCCVEAAFPPEYRQYIQKFGPVGLKSNTFMSRINAAIKNRFFLSTDVYAVKHKELEPLVSGLVSALRSDLSKISEYIK